MGDHPKEKEKQTKSGVSECMCVVSPYEKSFSHTLVKSFSHTLVSVVFDINNGSFLFDHVET